MKIVAVVDALLLIEYGGVMETRDYFTDWVNIAPIILVDTIRKKEGGYVIDILLLIDTNSVTTHRHQCQNLQSSPYSVSA